MPKQYIPAVEKGLREAMGEGVLAGYPVVDMKATLVDGSYHTVDSQRDGVQGRRLPGAQARLPRGRIPILLEPILEVEVVVPDEYMGDVMGQITSKRGHVLGMDSNDGMQHLRAQVPQAEMFHYATELRSITQGRGRFSWKLDHYAEVPHNVAEKVIAEHQSKVGAGEQATSPEVSSCARPRRRCACPAAAPASGRAAGRPPEGRCSGSATRSLFR